MNMFTKLAGLVAIFAKTPSIEELNEKLVSLTASARAIQNAADNEGRALSPEEEKENAGYFASFEITEAEIKRREKLESLQAKLDAPATRRSEPPPTPAPQAAAPNAPSPRVTGGDFAGATQGSGGFRSFGEYALSVRAAVVNPAGIDPRLRVLAVAPSTQSQEAIGADGGYLVPPDFRSNVLTKVQGEDSLLRYCDNQPISGNSVTFPTDETTPWQTSGGVQCYWEGEGAPIGQSKIALNSTTVRASKIAALIPVTDELLEDASSLSAYLNRKVPDKMLYKLNEAIVSGDGAMKPTGLLNSDCLITQTKESGQTAATINYQNIVKMWSRLYAPLRRNAIWITNQDIEPQLANLTAPGNTFPAYVGPGGLTNNFLNGSLMGRPIVYCDATAAVGTVGDLILADLSQYLAITKAGGIKSDVSMHLWFDYGMAAFRFTMRVGGQSWWASAVTRPGSKNSVSMAVALETRS